MSDMSGAAGSTRDLYAQHNQNYISDEVMSDESLIRRLVHDVNRQVTTTIND